MDLNGMIECVPNVSEGRNHEIINTLAVVFEVESDVHLLHIDANPDANRTVFTIVGKPEHLGKAMLSFYAVALDYIDMRVHQGRHPRIGAVDVCPFIPFDEEDVQNVIDFVREFAQQVAEKFKLPVYLYEKAALIDNRKNLADIRSGEFEGLFEKMKLPEYQPDFGPHYPHPTAGATAIGVRGFLIAYNISLDTNDLLIAQKIAALIRSRRQNEHTLPAVKAIGWRMESYDCVQVSVNLTDFRKTGLTEVFDRVKYLAASFGVDVLGSEVVGMLPLAAMLNAGKKVLEKGDKQTEVSEKTLIDTAITYLGLSLHESFIPAEKIIEYRIRYQ